MMWILLLLSQHKVTWSSGRIILLPYVFILLLVWRISTLGNSFLIRVLRMVLQVDAESICILTTFVFSPCLTCRFPKYFLANCGAVASSVMKVSSSVSSGRKLDCCCRACGRAPPLHTCKAILLTGLLMSVCLCVHLYSDIKNLILSNELLKVKLPPWKI